MSGTAEPSPAELHLGDRLAALIDGELEDDARERVLAHLATCACCKAEADAQRQVKSFFADTAPPPPSDGLLARLQGLPAGPPRPDEPSDSAPPFGGGLPGGKLPGGGLPGAGATSAPFGGPAELFDAQRGFRIHRGPGAEDRTGELERAASRGRRLAFAAAGAFSLAAVALGGALSTGSAGPGPAPTAAPPRTPAAGVERSERRGEQRAVAPLGQPVGDNSLFARPSTTAAPQAAGVPGVDGAEPAGVRPMATRFGSASLLSPPLIRAASRGGHFLRLPDHPLFDDHQSYRPPYAWSAPLPGSEPASGGDRPGKVETHGSGGTSSIASNPVP
ncbi:zf-HC2 domain-containing protein [Streptomyces alkaliterrae]|uniref:Zf-HC2 domain-containing protein n=1 Tax=Streptomyces alkaliterrae TaxID=2213162 RepID=A0A7W3X000_9ACTN|nr:zf-HC2 domain-containing protein [Streptomyces alkaliterrae]MBB1261633.1 zf-HC2 domain-containing protein [Streptomyces alkaliterrae]